MFRSSNKIVSECLTIRQSSVDVRAAFEVEILPINDIDN